MVKYGICVDSIVYINFEMCVISVYVNNKQGYGYINLNILYMCILFIFLI